MKSSRLIQRDTGGIAWDAIEMIEDDPWTLNRIDIPVKVRRVTHPTRGDSFRMFARRIKIDDKMRNASRQIGHMNARVSGIPDAIAVSRRLT